MTNIRETKSNLSNDRFKQSSTSELDLSGKTTIIGEVEVTNVGNLKIIKDAGTGKVLTSDSDGVASWTNLLVYSEPLKSMIYE